ncbi:hypothetical protein MNBD_DELTA03-1838, partial [hydrothermal vent metagenome]
ATAAQHEGLSQALQGRQTPVVMLLLNGNDVGAAKVAVAAQQARQAYIVNGLEVGE